jgi:hypothetical protein
MEQCNQCRCLHLSRQTFQQRCSRIYNHPTPQIGMKLHWILGDNFLGCDAVWSIADVSDELPDFVVSVNIPEFVVLRPMKSHLHDHRRDSSNILQEVDRNVANGVWHVLSAWTIDFGPRPLFVKIWWTKWTRNRGFSLNSSWFPTSIFIRLSQMLCSISN